MKDRIEGILLSEKRIKQRVRILAEKICRNYKGIKELNIVIILKGAFVFAADLGREIHKSGGPEIKYHFIKASTYGKEIKDSGEIKRKVKIELEPKDIKGKNVLLLEDIVDQGFTLFEIQKYLLNQKVSSLKTCVLLNKILMKPTEEVKKLRKKLVLDYVGFEIPDRWIAGYGIDAGEDFRHLPCVVIVKEKYYLNSSKFLKK